MVCQKNHLLMYIKKYLVFFMKSCKVYRNQHLKFIMFFFYDDRPKKYILTAWCLPALICLIKVCVDLYSSDSNYLL